MPEGRPPIPRDLRRRVLIEAGHRCAIPTCQATPVEIAHIKNWSIVKEHNFDNLIALCPTCHTRYDQGEIDRKAMLLYKEALRHRESAATLLHAERLTTYMDFIRAIDRWASTIGAIEMIDTDPDYEEMEAERGPAVGKCQDAAAKTQGILTRFRTVHEDDVVRLAEDVYKWVLYWANDVVDGLSPSTHPGADRHDSYDLGFIESDLLSAVADEVGRPKHDLDVLARGEPLRLGGTGKRF